MVGALTGASKAECADSVSRPESPPPSYASCVDAPPAELAFSPPLTARLVERHTQTLYDAIKKSPRAERIYLTRFERNVKLFITEHLQSSKGVQIPAEMYITANETMRVATISRDYQVSQCALGCVLPMSAVPRDPTLATEIIKYIACLPPFLNYLKDDQAWFDHLQVPGGVSFEVDSVELQQCEVFRQLIALTDALIAKDVSRDATPLKDMTEKLKLAINDQDELFDDLDEALESIIGFIEDGTLTEGIDSEEEMFELFYDTIVSDLFKSDQQLSTGLFSALKNAFTVYDQNIAYIRALCQLKKYYASTYFEKFAHKELHFEMEEQMPTGKAVDSLDYQNYEDRCRGILDNICLNPGGFHPNVAPLFILQGVLCAYLMKSFDHDQAVIEQTQDQINTQALKLNKSLRDVNYLLVERSIAALQLPVLSPEDAIKVVREVKFDPRCELIKNSYLALFETLARMKLTIENPVVTYKPF